MPDRPTLLLTRPEDQSRAFLGQLTARTGRDVPHVISPLLRIEDAPFDAPDPDAVLLFTSANGVRAFAGRYPGQGRLALCVGDTTAAAAAAAGFDAHSANGAVADLAALAGKLVAPGAAPLVHIAGEHVAGALAETLGRAGYDVARITAYRQVAQALTPDAQAALTAGPVIAPLFSPRTARVLMRELDGMEPAGLTLVALSPDVAAAAPRWRATVAPRPTRSAMIDTLIALL